MEPTASSSNTTLLKDIKQWNLIYPSAEEFIAAGRRIPKRRDTMCPRWEVRNDAVCVTHKPTFGIESLIQFISGSARLDVVFDCMFRRLSELKVEDFPHQARSISSWKRNLQKLDVNVQTKLSRVGSHFGITVWVLQKLGIVPRIPESVEKKAKVLSQLIRTFLTEVQEIDSKGTVRPSHGSSNAHNAPYTDKVQQAVYTFDKPLSVYSTPKDGDMRNAILSAISQAKTSIHLFMYSLTDAKIIQALEKKAQDGVEVIIIHDKDAFKYAHKELDPKIKKYCVECKNKGIMHRKMISIDRSLVYLGSANMTSEALTKDKNLCTFVRNTAIAEMISKKAESIIHQDSQHRQDAHEPSFISCTLENGIDVELSLLPDDTRADHELLSLISTAQKSCEIAMFTFTRGDIAQKVVDLHKQGKKVQVIIDGQQAHGTGKKVAAMLKEAKVPTIVAHPNHFLLMHHKFARIDSHIIAHGSANYTEQAFHANWDYIVYLKNLPKAEQTAFDSMWNALVESVTTDSKIAHE